MKVLYIAADVHQIGGIELYNRFFLKALKEAGADVSLIELKGRGVWAKILFVLKIFLRQVTNRPEVILCAHINFSPVCFMAEKIFGTPYTVSLYGIDAINVQSALKLSALAAAEKVIVISEYTAECILKQLPQIKEKIYSIPTAVDDTKFVIKDRPAHYVKKYHLEHCPVILTIARLNTEEHKGYDRVMKALPQVAKEFPDVRYVLVGKGSDVRVNELMKDPLLRKHTILAGRAEDNELPDYYNLADVFAMPSKFEGFSIVHKEALMCGRPVIASRGYGGYEALMNGELGLVVDPDNIDEIAAAIIGVLKKKVSPRILDKQWVRARALELYGVKSFNERVKKLLTLL